MWCLSPSHLSTYLPRQVSADQIVSIFALCLSSSVMSVCLSVCLSVFLSVCLFVCLFVCFLSVCLLPACLPLCSHEDNFFEMTFALHSWSWTEKCLLQKSINSIAFSLPTSSNNFFANFQKIIYMHQSPCSKLHWQLNLSACLSVCIFCLSVCLYVCLSV